MVSGQWSVVYPKLPPEGRHIRNRLQANEVSAAGGGATLSPTAPVGRHIAAAGGVTRPKGDIYVSACKRMLGRAAGGGIRLQANEVSVAGGGATLSPTAP